MTLEEFIAGIKRRAAHLRKVKRSKKIRRSRIQPEPEPRDVDLEAIEEDEI